MEYQSTFNLINQSHSILVVTHVSPDGDAIGSLLAFGQILNKLGKTDIILACDDGVPEKHRFLPGTDTVVNALPAGKTVDLVISVDCSDARRGGRVFQAARMDPVDSINIDHHITNTQFATTNIVLPQAASTTQVIVQMLNAWGIDLDRDLALCLLTGLVTDTLCFRTANVSAQVMEVAAQLMQAGADLSFITQHTVNRKPYNAIRYWGTLLENVQLDERVISAYASAKQRYQSGFAKNGDASIVTLLNTAQEADMAVSFVESDSGSVEISFRARPGFDVSQIALSLGGGGHPAAAGCTIDGPLEQVTERVLATLKEERRRQSERS